MIAPPTLPGTRPSVGALRECARCDTTAPPDGGVTMGDRWICAKCWRGFSLLGPKSKARRKLS